MIKVSSALGLCVLLGACAAVPPPPPEMVVWDDGRELAQARPNPEVDLALRSYAEEDYDTAAEAFERAYAIEAAPALLFARAQALRLAGDCRRALPLYEEFLGVASDPTYYNAVLPLIEECALRTGTSTTAMRPSAPNTSR